jgi:hypothetical protein
MENDASFLYTQCMEPQQNPRIIIPALAISGVLFLLVISAFITTKNRQSTIVLPGGVTYLGPTPTGVVKKNPTGATIPVPENATWAERKGKIYPFSFSYPTVLSLGEFPNDPFDAVTVFYEGTDANANIFLRIEDMAKQTRSPKATTLQAYATDWWRDYSWKGVHAVTPLTTAKGLSGFRATYVDTQGNTPYDHVFLQVPGKANLVIWVSGRLFAPDIFNRLVDSIRWEN